MLALRTRYLSKAPKIKVLFYYKNKENYSKARNEVANDQLRAKSFLQIDDGLSDHVTDSPRLVADEALHRLRQLVVCSFIV